MMIGILGSGFGLYGYVPAAVNLNMESVFLPKQYREKFLLRPELQQFANKIIWVESGASLIDICTTIVVSRRPEDQYRLLKTILSKSQITNIILEKPIAVTPESAMKLEKLILDSNKKCSVGYVFRYTSWAITLQNLLKKEVVTSKNNLNLKWSFMAHHYVTNAKNWKQDHSQGGGALRFYGIQVIALLAELGYRDVDESCIVMETSDMECSLWKAKFKTPKLPDFNIEINSRSSNDIFAIRCDTENLLIYSEENPFGKSNNADIQQTLDQRCIYLERLMRDNHFQKEKWPNIYSDTIKLWAKVERITSYL